MPHISALCSSENCSSRVVGTPHFRTSHALISNILIQTLDFIEERTGRVLGEIFFAPTHQHINTSTNQQINKSTDQQINKSTDQQINKSTNPQINSF